MSDKRHLSQLSDDEVEALYHKHGDNATAAAREVGCGPSTFRARIGLLKDESYRAAKEAKNATAFIMEELEARGIDPRTIKVGAATVKTSKKRYNAFHKDQETGKAVVTPMKSDDRSVSIKFSPKFQDGPKWPVIQPATPAIVQYTPRPSIGGPERRVFLWPDTQIGFYRSVQTGELTPFHDLQAIDVALQMLKAFNADEVVILGDFIDLAMLSRWTQLPEFQATLQPAIYYSHILLANIRSIVGPSARITYIAGNHERRLAQHSAENAMASHGIRAAETNLDLIDLVTLVPKVWDWPHNSIPKLLQLQHLNIEYTAEYPGGEVWLTPKIVCTHPPEKGQKKVIRANVFHGHIPRASVETHTIHYHDGTEEYSMVAVPGLMRVDDVSDKALLSRTSVASNGSRMDWQQGVGTILIFEDDLYTHEIGRIKNGRGILGGQLFEAKKPAA